MTNSEERKQRRQEKRRARKARRSERRERRREERQARRRERAERRQRRRTSHHRVPNATWRAELLSEADRLDAERTRAAASFDQQSSARGPSWPQKSAENNRIAEQEIGNARRAADWPGYFRMLWRWGSGSDIETGWRSLHTADQALLELQDDATVLSRLPEIKAAVAANLPSDDNRIHEYGDILDSFIRAENPAALDRELVRQIKQAADAASDAAHSNLRNYRNWLVIVGLVLTLGLLAVAIAHGAHDEFFKVCRKSGNPHPGGCPSVDLGEIEAAGAVGGLVAAIFALSRLKAYGGPYALPLWQALLRIPSGASAALAGIVIMQAGIISSLSRQPAENLLAYALLFGYAPDFVLRLLDQRVNAVSESARTKNDPARKAETPS